MVDTESQISAGLSAIADRNVAQVIAGYSEPAR